MKPAIVLICASLAACSTTPNLDKHIGEQLDMLRAQQTLHPDAALQPRPESGMNGQAAKSAYEQYQKSFKAPEPQTQAFTIGVGTNSGGK